jgi:hypothetical protein
MQKMQKLGAAAPLRTGSGRQRSGAACNPLAIRIQKMQKPAQQPNRMGTEPPNVPPGVN